MTTVRRFADRLLGRGEASSSVPVMDGALQPNRALDDAEVMLQQEGLDDLASDGRVLYVSAGNRILRLDGTQWQELRSFDAAVTALAAHADGRVAVALDGREVRCLQADGVDSGMLREAGGRPLHSVNALAFAPHGGLLITDGALNRSCNEWPRDLMEHGCGGRVIEWLSGQSTGKVRAGGLRHAWGALPVGDGLWVSESWRHRVMDVAPIVPAPVLQDLPAYPGRLAHASGGGAWLTCFSGRTQLVEFVLREDAFRRRMLAEVDPRYWIAPSLSSGASFLEPLQGAGVKQMGVLKPWAPPRSYGLVIRLDAAGRPTGSLHGRVDGARHGITAVAEFGGMLHVISKGSGALLRLPLASLPGA